MSGLVWALIFGVGYPLVTVAVWTVGAFGIAATAPELREATRERARAEWHSGMFEAQYSVTYYRFALAGRWSLAFAAGLLWPLAAPLWIGWRKGAFLAEALQKRDAEVTELRKRAA